MTMTRSYLSSLRPRAPALATPYPSKAEVVRVTTAAWGVSRWRVWLLFRLSTTALKMKGTVVLSSLAETRIPREVRTVFLILGSSAGQI